jgi:hypothetical protein
MATAGLRRRKGASAEGKGGEEGNPASPTASAALPSVRGGAAAPDTIAHIKAQEGLGETTVGKNKSVAKAVKRPAAWHPPQGVKLSRNQIFQCRRRAVEEYAVYLGFDLR